MGTNSQEKSVQTQTEPVKRGRKPGSKVWTHEKVMARSMNAGIIDKAKLAWLGKVYGVQTEDDNVMRVMILAHHSEVNRLWAESDEFATAKSDIQALEAEAEAAKARAKVADATAGLTAESIVAALTPEQLASILALAAQVQK